MDAHSTDMWLQLIVHLSYTFDLESISFLSVIFHKWYYMTQGLSIWLKGLCWDISVPLCCSKVDMHKRVAVTDYCTSADPLCLLLVDKQGEVIPAGLAHSEGESWLKFPYICHGPRACVGRSSTSDQIMHYNLLTFSNLCGLALTLTEILLNIIKFKREKRRNYTQVYSLYRYLCDLSS